MTTTVEIKPDEQKKSIRQYIKDLKFATNTKLLLYCVNALSILGIANYAYPSSTYSLILAIVSGIIIGIQFMDYQSKKKDTKEEKKNSGVVFTDVKTGKPIE